MNLKNPSMSSALALAGVGLISLSFAEIFVASSQSALAAPGDGRRLQVPGVPITADRGVPSTFDGPPPMVGMGAADGCAQGEPLDWFGAIRALPECWIADDELLVPLQRFEDFSGRALGSLFDLNGDGRAELIRGRMIDNNLANVQCAIASIEVVRQGDEFVLVEHCVLSGAVLRAFAASVGLPAEVGDAGLVDLDRDGDLDVVFQLGTWGHWHPFWIENTGFEATQPLAGDLDGDGAVGASDLTMLLGGWTGS